MVKDAPKPPEISGFKFKRALGSGGFADVYLYSDVSLGRDVAVKVLKNTLEEFETLETFEAESRLMAKVSGHPNIVQIYTTGVSEDGRPYIVMQYYPNPPFSQRIRKKPLGLAEALKTGVQICSAVEAAHRAGIIHRDIKPANLLTGQYGDPALTDFGIAGAGADDSVGYSPPYAAPEIIEDASPGDRASDVYSLAATIYALLEGRSPFETESAENTRSAVTERVLNSRPFPFSRPDIPAMLERVVLQALDKDPSKRPQTAQDLARSLQQVQQHLRHSVTELVLETSADSEIGTTDEASEPYERTRFGGANVVDPSRPASLSDEMSVSVHPVEISASGASAPKFEEPREAGSLVEDPTVLRTEPKDTSQDQPFPAAPKSVPVPGWALVLGALVVIAAIGGGILAFASGRGVPSTTSFPSTTGSLIVAEIPEPPTGVAIERVTESSVAVKWIGVDGADSYQVGYRYGFGGDRILTLTDKAGLAIYDVPTDANVCVEVATVVSGRTSELSKMVCEDGG